MKHLFEQRKKQISGFKTIMNVSKHLAAKKELPDNVIHLCHECHKPSTIEHFKSNAYVCVHCDAHSRLSASQRLLLSVDKDSFIPLWSSIKTPSDLDFPDYQKKLEHARAASGLNEAIIIGEATLEGHPIAIGVMDAAFMMGSMGSVVGELLTRLIEVACEKRLPLIVFVASGGARMQEGIISLMQMAKTTQAMKHHHDLGLLSIMVLTHPTTGGVSASFAMLADFIIAEPRALIGFAGKRVIEKTIQQSLPEHFQSAEFGLEQGFIDMIVHRHHMKSTLHSILSWVKGGQHEASRL